MPTSTELAARTRIRVSPGVDGGRCRVRSAVTTADPASSAVRPMLLHHDRVGARMSLVPEGALLLAGDGVEIDVRVDAGARLDLVEPGGTVAFAMRGRAASWSVRVTLGDGAVLTWAGEPFVVAEGAVVRRDTTVRMAASARLALRETLVLGRYGEGPGAIDQRTRLVVDGVPTLVEHLPLTDRGAAAALLGGHRVLASVLAVGGSASGIPGPDAHRFDLEGGPVLWRRLGSQAHEAGLEPAWQAASEAAAEGVG